MTSTIGTLREVVAETVTDGLGMMTGTETDARGTQLSVAHFATGLATEPRSLVRRGLGLLAALVVPPGSCAVAYLPGGEQRCYQPGSYTLFGIKPGAILVQWVDMRRRQAQIGPVEGLSADKWRVSFWLLVDYHTDDPVLIAAHREPLIALGTALRTAALAYIERHTHAELTGCVDATGGLDAPATAILHRLRDDPALQGLAIISVRIANRQGDERQIEAAMHATVTAAQIDEALRIAAAQQRADLYTLESRAALQEREHGLRMAATAANARERLLEQQSAVQQAALTARQDLVLAQIRAQVAEIERDEQAWQSDQNRMQAEWERVQQQLLDAHRTDQQLRLMDAQHAMVRTEGETALAAEDRRNAHALALADVQQRLAEQRALHAQAINERRAQHERALLELHLRHEQLVAEQMQRLELWRTEQVQVRVHQQRQHDRQLAAMAGTAQIAAAAATLPPLPDELPGRSEVADAGLRALQSLAE